LRSRRDSREAIEAARTAGLRYVDSNSRGLSRIRGKRGFTYLSVGGQAIRAQATLRRIDKLVIPPAWTDVWICPDPRGHLQATGRDAKGRKQHRYHTRWLELRDATKYDRMAAFGRALPKLRGRLRRDLRRPGFSREKILATLVALLEKSLIRVGNEEYAQQNGSVGLTTMRNRHVDVSGSKLCFQFRGKSGVMHEVDVRDRRLAHIVKSCQELPGQELFQYLDQRGKRRKLDSADVNEYLRNVMGDGFTAKDFRTWGGTLLAAEALQQLGAPPSHAAAKRNVAKAIEAVARQLGNTKTICRKCYVHPALVASYVEGDLLVNGFGYQHGKGSREKALLTFLRHEQRRKGERKVARRL
jgi:DNA topoisomerase-1